METSTIISICNMCVSVIVVICGGFFVTARINKKLAEQKVQLDLMTHKQSKLHEKRIIVFGELFSRLKDFQFNMRELTARIKNVGEDGKAEDIARFNKTGLSYNEALL